ncbi:MAG TPA: hypothetical protein VFR55_10655 [Dehalococcoidia bacterium]|nr:hypothetical protein [Dehalococcoidia bacterium]
MHLVQLVDDQVAGPEVEEKVGDAGPAAGAAQGVLASGQAPQGLQETCSWQ